MVKNHKKVIILGAGISGLSAGWKLSEEGFDVTIIDSSGQVGGLSTSFSYQDMVLDYGPHKIYTQIDGVLDEVKGLLSQDFRTQVKTSSIYLENKMFTYPFKMQELLFGLRFMVGLRCFTSYFFNLAKKPFRKNKILSYEDYVVDKFGRGLYALVFEPLAEKIWGDPRNISFKIAQMRIAMPSLTYLIKTLLFKDKAESSQIDAKVFYYPRQGIRQLPEKMREKIILNRGNFLLNSKIISIDIDAQRVTSVTYEQAGRSVKLEADYLISTIPINQSIGLIAPRVSDEVLDASRRLRFRSLFLIYIILKRPRVTSGHWLFFPEKRFFFNRLFEQKSFSQEMIPETKTAICLDLTFDSSDGVKFRDESLICRNAIKHLEEIGVIHSEDVLEYFTYKRDNVYPVYDLGFQENLSRVLDFESKINNLFFLGRLGLYNYNNMDHCIDMGIKIARCLKEGGNKQDWEKARESFSKYKIVD